MGLKLYAQLDSVSVRLLTEAAHRAGMPVWGHAWVQPASVMEQARAGQDGVVHAAGLAGELFTVEDRDTLVRRRRPPDRHRGGGHRRGGP